VYKRGGGAIGTDFILERERELYTATCQQKTLSQPL